MRVTIFPFGACFLSSSDACNLLWDDVLFNLLERDEPIVQFAIQKILLPARLNYFYFLCFFEYIGDYPLSVQKQLILATEFLQFDPSAWSRSMQTIFLL